MPQNGPTREQLERTVPEILRVINQSHGLLAWYEWRLSIPRLTDGAEGVIIWNAVFEGTLLNLRKLNEFFIPRRNHDRDDDIRATDFPGFTGQCQFLSSNDLAEIHKRFAH